MESLTGIRWRKTLKPIQTKTTSEEGSGDIGAEGEPLSPGARMFHEKNFNLYVIAIVGGLTPMDNLDAVIQNLPDTLLKHPRFSSLQVLDEETGEMRWVPTKVNVMNHIIVPDIPSNLDNPDKFLEEYLYDLSKTSIDMSKPMWELHVLHIKTSTAQAIGIFRLHHSLGDGTSLMSLVLACTRQVSNPDAVPTVPKYKNGKGPFSGSFGGAFDSGGSWFTRCFLVFWMFFRLMWNTAVDVTMFFVTALFLKDTKTPLTAPHGSEFTPRRFVFRTVSLDDMKLIKNAMNLTINDVALGVTQAGLSKYLNRRYGQINRTDKGATEKKNNIPKNIRLRSTLLINLRPTAGIQELADMMKKDSEAKWGTWIGYVLLPFKIGLRDDPLDYVREAKATVDRKKSSLEALYTFSIVNLTLKFFGTKVVNALSHRIITNTTLCFSNLAGPMQETGFYGHAMTFLAPSSYGQPHGLVINFQSYVNKMTIVLSVDDSTIPDPHQLCDDLEEALQLIKEAVIAKGLVKE